MKIECTVEELKELLKKETPVAGTTDDKTRVGLVFKDEKTNL